jgi:hypothetical protein
VTFLPSSATTRIYGPAFISHGIPFLKHCVLRFRKTFICLFAVKSVFTVGKLKTQLIPVKLIDVDDGVSETL